MGKKIFIGCLAVAILGFLTVAGIGYWFYKSFTGRTPEQVVQLAQELAPGSHVPQGFAPGLSMDLAGLKMVDFENNTTRQHLSLIQIPVKADQPVPTREELVPSLKVTLSQEDRKRFKVSSQESAVELKGEKDSFPFFKRLVTERGESKWEWCTLAWGATDHQHAIMIQASSPQNAPEDKFLRDYVQTLQLTPYCQSK
ncbi:hypothetical protein JST97_36710 [bacterium]|nr:hypothetical protein [bacterium]